MSDLISKEEAVAILLEAKEAGCVDKYTNAIRKSNFDEAIECIQGMPTVEAEPVRHGRWNKTIYPDIRECSCCGAMWAMERVEGFVYCPKCGAKMDAERKEE